MCIGKRSSVWRYYFQLKGKMMQWRKLSRRNLLVIILICAGYLFVDYVLSSRDYTDNKEKIEIIEESIRSLANQGQCKMPNLPVDSPEMLSFLKDEQPIFCGNEDDDWVSCHKSICSIKQDVVKAKGKITCDFTDILRKTDYRTKYGDTIRSSDNYKLQESDFARAKCWTEGHNERWYGILIGVRDDSSLSNRRNWNKDAAINVLMLGFDSLSKNAFIRKLPKSYKYLKKYLKGDVLEGYNIVGDGTPQALIPLLTGFTELELPETRKRMKNSEYVNVYPMIWKEYEKYGFVTSFNEDVPNIGTFSYRLNGFDAQPTDHYMRTYYLAVESQLSYYKRLCIGAQPRHKVMLDYTKDFMLKYSSPRFVFSFHGELSHDSINLVGVADTDLTNWMMDIKKAGILNNTILILMSDHGNRFAEVRNTLQGKQEERLPFFSFTFPEWFKKQYESQYKNFQDNLHRLVTPFDVHATLQDILNLQTYKSKQKPLSSRAISLFDNIPENRSCADAYIEPHWCACLNWKQINDSSSEEVYRAAMTIIDFINKYTEVHRDLCSTLSLDEIKWAAKLSPHENLVRFKQNKDLDGFLADLSSTNTQIANEMYQVKIVTNPGKSIFEGSVLHDLKTNQFKIKLSDISRINKYGDQAKCIYDKDPELRKYCYCQD